MKFKGLTALFTVLILAGCGASPETEKEKKTAAIFWGVDGFPKELVENTIPKKAEAIGFTISDAHKRINDAYVTKYGSTTLDTLNFVGIGNEEALYKVINSHPKSAAFIPMTLFSYKAKNENSSWVGLLSPDYTADAIGLNDPAMRKEWTDAFSPLHTMIETELKPKYIEKAYYTDIPDTPLFEITYPIKEGEGKESFIETFQEKFEEAFVDEEFIIAGYRDVKDNLEMAGIENNYDAFFVYSICHFYFSNAFFNEIPRAGIFAPCSVYFYIPKGEKKMYAGFPTLKNWVKVMGITDPDKLAMVAEYDLKVADIMESLGGKKVLMTRFVEVKERIPLTLEKGEVNANFTIRDMDADTVTKRLKKAGFKIVGSHMVSGDAGLKTILFTNDALAKAAAKPNRGFAAVLRVMVDEGRREAIIQNPEYNLRAFLQDDYDVALGKNLTYALDKAFPEKVYTIADKLDRDDLAGFRFMVGMPYYEDMDELASGETQELLKNLLKNGADRVVFDLKLSNDSYLVGLDLGRKVEKFIYKTGTDEALLLPYLVLIEGGQVKMLAPKYYIALMYPQLTMTEFLKIANVPGIIEKEIKSLFK